MRLSFASPLQHDSGSAAVSTLIGIETAPTVLNYIVEPPDTISINEVFEIVLEP